MSQDIYVTYICANIYMYKVVKLLLSCAILLLNCIYSWLNTLTKTRSSVHPLARPPFPLPSASRNRRRVTATTKKKVAARQRWSCGLCGQLLDETYEVDHIIPLFRGGTNDLDNLMALDPHCHRKKTQNDQTI